MGKFQPVFLLLLSLLITGCATQQNEAPVAQVQPQEASDNHASFTNSQFSVEYPDGWEVKEQQQLGIISFISPKETELDSFRENFNAYAAATQPGFGLDDYAQLGVEQLEEALDEFKLTSLKPATLSGIPARRIEYTAMSRGQKLNYVQVTAVKGDFIYTLTYSGISSKYGTYEAQMERAIKSFKIKP
ncbi:DcrB-related protein [Candidatus Woesearchaeota archaeon]|nr:DcrB-related protein [Candidatus Woesearchaeota archaeon]